MTEECVLSEYIDVVDVVDIETSGLSYEKHQILQIGVWRVNLSTGESRLQMNQYLKPDPSKQWDEKAMEVNGLSEPFLSKYGWDYGQIRDALARFRSPAVPMASYPAEFDIPFLATLDTDGDILHLRRNSLCIRSMAYMHTGKILSLKNMAQELSIPFEEGETLGDVASALGQTRRAGHHAADYDALIASQILLKVVRRSETAASRANG